VMAVCQPGENLLASGYCMYSSSVIFVLSVGTGVYGFTLDPLIGEFVLTHDNIQIPKSGKIYSFNEGNYELWDDKLKRWVLVVSDSTSSALFESTDFPRRLEIIPLCALYGHMFIEAGLVVPGHLLALNMSLG
jgi:fructose-1,6-bisphosphatase